MKLRKRPEAKKKVEKKEKSSIEVKKEKESSSIKKKKKAKAKREKRLKKTKKKASNKKADDTVEVIEIPPVVHCAVTDVVSAMEAATKEELELKEECSIIFECNQCDSFFRSIGSYLDHKVTLCCESSCNFSEDLIHKVYSWKGLDNCNQEMKKGLDPLTIDSTDKQNIKIMGC